MKITTTRHPLMPVSRALLGLFILLSSLFTAQPVLAGTLSSDLAALVTQGQAVDAQIAGINLTSSNSCTELKLASTSIADWLAAMETVYNGVNSAFSVDAATLTSLDDLSNLTVSIAGRIYGLSQDINNINDVAELIEYDASLAAMLRLSDDIGSMANRIGEMADRILVMADNIGLMADRILVTQQLQSTNVIATQNSILATQQNMVALSNTIATVVYNPALASLLTQANALSTSMGLVSLNSLNMSTQLASVEVQATAYLDQLVALYTIMMLDSQDASHYINGDTLTMAGDLSNVHISLSLALETYANKINQVAPYTAKPILSSATDSMLRLTKDIGVMSDRIMEMVDRIVVMADNIGDMSTRIVDTQNIQQTNIELTQASLKAASSTTVSVIASYGL